jgi:hypothetical protein
VSELLCWIGSSKDKLKNAESLRGMRSMRKTKPFGSKPPRVGKSSFERSNKIHPLSERYAAKLLSKDEARRIARRCRNHSSLNDQCVAEKSEPH